MEQKKFERWNRVVATAVLIVASVTYLATIEPTASFWDCGEFVASSYKLEVGHPPGNPVFQLIARAFTLFSGPETAALAINAMSAVCSALTIFFLYLTIVFFARRLFAGKGGLSVSQAVAVMGSGAVGALVYCFSDTFWFSAVEAEVYAMSSLFTAMVFWAMTKWYEQADRPRSSRWIVLIAFLMGLSIGVHLLNLLAIPALVFMYFYRKKEDGKYTFRQLAGIFLLSMALTGLLVFILIPYIPKFAAYCDLLFVNVFGLPVNSGAAFFLIASLAACFAGLFSSYRKGAVLLNTSLLCFTSILIGFSIFSIIIIRSGVKTPTNENQPDNAFSLVRYLSREQYGSSPLIYGQSFDSPYEISMKSYWVLLNGKYVKADAPADGKYYDGGKMFFPRMWNGADERYIRFYEDYMNGKFRYVREDGQVMTKDDGSPYKLPTFGANLRYFFDYQLHWMYWRYFMWNFVGRQNDIHSPAPGELFFGNWESGISFIDGLRLSDQSGAPELLSGNKGKNHYYFLPLLLGLLGLFFQFDRDRRGSWLVFLMFFMTGIAIVLYLNQPPYQVRERDYAYAGSFYMFSIWAGLAVAAVSSWISSHVAKRRHTAVAGLATLACLCVPALMAAQNWDDHDRSNRRTSVEMATNLLNSVGPGGYLITHGDNDTFPLWYAQEVEGIRNDVRILNTSLLGTDWYIDQMRYAINNSAPVPLGVDQRQYLSGTNDYVFIYDTRSQVIPISDVMRIFRHPDAKLVLQSGRKVDYIMSRKISVPVNKENALASGIVPPQFEQLIPDSLVLSIPEGKQYLSKPELFFLDLLSQYEWDRPLHMLSQGGDINIGLKEYLMYDGFSSHLVPFKNKLTSSGVGMCDAETLYTRIMDGTFRWDALSRTDYFIDYQNYYTFLGVYPQRDLFCNVARLLLASGQAEKAEEVLDKCVVSIPRENYPYETVPIGMASNDIKVLDMIDLYYQAGAVEKGDDIAVKLEEEIFASLPFYLSFGDYAGNEFELLGSILYRLREIYGKAGRTEAADRLSETLDAILDAVSGVR